MIILKILYILVFFSFSFSSDIQKEVKQINPHVSLVIHESLINDFFANTGKITGVGNSEIIDYNWSLLNPRIEILKDQALFFAQINVKHDLFSFTRDVEGSVKVVYNEEENLIIVSVDEADLILDVDLFGKNILLGEIDIAKYFSKDFTYEGIKPFNNEVDFTLPNTKKKRIKVNTKQYELILLEDMIQLNAEFIFDQEIE